MRTDAQLKNDVMEELRWEPTVNSSDINVVAKDGVVTLSGMVPHYAEKRAAERATQRVEGVKAIAEEMEVHLVKEYERKDSEIAQAVVDALRWHVWVPIHIQATVEKGWVTLTGSVKWGYERNSAEDAVTYLTGVSAIGAGLYSIGIPKKSILQYETSLKAGTFMLVVHGTPDEVTRAKAVLGTTGASEAHLHLAEVPIEANV